MKKINLEVTCKLSLFVYWNSCKRLPKFRKRGSPNFGLGLGLLSAPGDREKRPCFTANFVLDSSVIKPEKC